MHETKTLKVIISGHVQGVGFRYWVEKEAGKRDLCGWVRNCKGDGTVEALFHGSADKVDDMVRACRHGPLTARVDRVSSEPVEFDGSIDFLQKDSV